jgi:sodium transport system ATP-binding protein
MIVATQLGKKFQDRKKGAVAAVENVSFTCRAGEIYGLLGANGAGKTTTLRMLATILRPTSGTALVAGFDINKDPESVRAKIGFLSTATALYARLTGREVVEYFGRLNGLEGRSLASRIDELFELLDIAKFAGVRCDKLSTGMKQKVSIARTLVHDPPVMVFDEPTLGLDVMSARAIVQFIRSCRDRGKTVIFSSHVMSEVEKLCDVIGILHGGRLLCEGSLRDLREKTGLSDLEDIFVRTVESAP